MANSAVLAINIVSDATDGVKGMDAVGRAADRMGSAVKDSARDMDKATSKMDKVGSAADTMDDKAGKATGALGALSSGFELVGAEKYAGGLQAAALATDFVSGAGQALNLVMSTQAVVTARATASKIAAAAASKAMAAGTAVVTASQWALNAALTANPIGLVIAAVVAVVALLVILYKRSETVRGILQKLGKIGAAAIGAVVGAVTGLVGWFRDRLPGALNLMRNIAVRAFNAYTLPIRTVINLVSGLIGWIRDRLPAAMNTAKAVFQRVGDALLAPFRAVKNMIESIIRAIGRIDIPSLSDLNPFGRMATTAFSGSGGSFSTTTQNITYNNTVVGAYDPRAVANQLSLITARQARQVGG